MYPVYGIQQIKYTFKILTMQEEEKILSNAVAKILKNIRFKTKKSLNLFCNEFDISTSTLNDLENGKRSVRLYSLYKILKAYDVSVIDFFKLLEKELPKNFLKPDE